jgi:hypothetical protein|tara:strand:- start:2 stop:148 length:147 start_codon:yes stop_codon:yes gene_type:complete
MKLQYHPVYYDSQEIRYRVIAVDNGKIMYERIFNKEEQAKAYVKKHNE